ncbi:MAG: 3-hydroxyacyl-ACP dehydratase FabZ family protein [Stenotrophomonas sp.]|uniref:3-hydroxyacyl-ACP dehydratase FabZ family protein n=1 Tax=Stenotrophomonas sp. TaxID=69392 RepID=UPI003D6D2044
MQFSITPDHPCLPGHFPGRPLVPGVVLLEQVLCALEAELGAETGLLRLPQVKFMAPLLPGQTARIELEGQSPRWKFRVLRDAELLVRGELVLEAAGVQP